MIMKKGFKAKDILYLSLSFGRNNVNCNKEKKNLGKQGKHSFSENTLKKKKKKVPEALPHNNAFSLFFS